VEIRFACDAAAGEVEIESQVRTVGRTGVEMEAMTAVGVAALTIYDMCKAVDREMVLTDIRLMSKQGGKSGVFIRPESTV
jgi:cyclic pyranopterin phosphate synthase